MAFLKYVNKIKTRFQLLGSYISLLHNLYVQFSRCYVTACHTICWLSKLKSLTLTRKPGICLNNYNVLITVQRDATHNSLFIILQVHSTRFGCQPHPSSGLHKTVTTASGTGTTLQRGHELAAQKKWPACVGIFHWHKILRVALRPWGRLSL